MAMKPGICFFFLLSHGCKISKVTKFVSIIYDHRTNILIIASYIVNAMLTPIDNNLTPQKEIICVMHCWESTLDTATITNKCMIGEPSRNSRQIFFILCPVALRDKRSLRDNFCTFNLYNTFLFGIFDRFSRIYFSNVLIST